jgi:hypothetical protein
MSDEQLIDVIASVCGFDRAGVERWRTEALIIGRAVEQASRRAALEEAEKVCDEKQDWYEKDRCIGQATAVGACADEIRALAASDSEGGES